MKTIKSVLCVAVASLVSTVSYAHELRSPDNDLVFSLRSTEGELRYNIDHRDTPVILPSALGITDWEKEMEIVSVEESSFDAVWRPVYGERSEVADRYNQAIYIVKTPSRRDLLHIVVRAYDEGIALRYKYTGNNYLRITEESTTFRVPEGTYCWFAPFAQASHKKMAVEDWPGEAERPLTLQLAGGLYAALGEAGVVNYSRTKFFVERGEENLIRCRMYDAVEDAAPFETPWRVVMVAESPGKLLENNDIYLNLNRECAIDDTGWIKPGKIMRVTRLNTAASMEMVDFAVRRKLDYIHYDAGWYGPEASKTSDPRRPINGLDLPGVVRYARSKGVGVWVYVNQRALQAHLDEILPLYREWGIAGIKFGFVYVGSSRWTAWLHEAVAKCAEYGLMVDIHDEYRPTGFSRTYPNLLTQEGVRGNEEFPDGENNTTLPFTRFLAGAADATVCYYHRPDLKPGLANSLNARSLLNTACHQMALSVINYSPLQFLYWYDTPQDSADEPELTFFDELKTVWDDTRVVEGSIGEYATIARRSGNKWFVGSITNNGARKFELTLNFLDPDKKYEMRLFTDGGEKVETRTHVAIETRKVTAKTSLRLDLLPRGGCAMIIEEK